MVGVLICRGYGPVSVMVALGGYFVLGLVGCNLEGLGWLGVAVLGGCGCGRVVVFVIVAVVVVGGCGCGCCLLCWIYYFNVLYEKIKPLM